jgi:hypothetical protein
LGRRGEGSWGGELGEGRDDIEREVGEGNLGGKLGKGGQNYIERKVGGTWEIAKARVLLVFRFLVFYLCFCVSNL